MSDDDSEDEVRDGVVVATRYKKRRPVWRGFPLEHILYTLDNYTAVRKASKIGRRTRKPGARPRIREESNMVYLGRVPPGLHRNLYHNTYLQSLQPWEVERLAPRQDRYPHQVRRLPYRERDLTAIRLGCFLRPIFCHAHGNWRVDSRGI